MPGSKRRILIVGGGAVGPKAASRARRLDPNADIKIIEKGKYVSYGACGMPYYISGDIKALDELLARDPEHFRKELQVDVLLETEAVSIDRASRTLHCRDGTGKPFPLPYDALVLATGARPFVPPLEGRELNGIFKLKDLTDAIAITEYMRKEEPRRAAIVGAGLIGLEMAEAFRTKGLSVTVVEMLDWPLPALLDFEMGALVSRELEAHGVKVLLSGKAEGFEGTQGGRVKKLRTSSESIECEIALMSIGVRPEVALAREAGLEIGATRAISVNEFLQTSDSSIYAGGDCAECRHLVTGKPVFVPLGSTANKHGRVIGTNVVGARDRFPGIVGTAIAKVFDITVGRTGLTEKEAKENGYETVSSVVAPGDIAHYYPGGHTITLKLLADARTGKVLGAQCVGRGEVAKRIDVIATAITYGTDVSQLANLDLAYAPPYSPAMDAVHHAANVIRNKMDGNTKGIAAPELKKKMNGEASLLVVDVRTSQEWKLDRLDSPKVKHIPAGELSDADVELCREKEVVTYCRSGVRAYKAQKVLEAKGCKNVRFLDGSLSAWPYKTKK